ncbi:MAG: hypothetical protein HC824_18230 [Synechococcales cyanobacterium RM1_1_8]|nr:hypothetical protein [Synechococcales cyanobacterium RM1_1_8]
MQQENHLILNQAINEQPLIVTPELALTEVIHRMNQDWGRSCQLSEGAPESNQGLLFAPRQPRCALIMEAGRLQGIFTERDLVKRIAAGLPLQGLSVAEAMTQPVIALGEHEVPDVFTALAVMQRHQIRHLPILNEQGGAEGRDYLPGDSLNPADNGLATAAPGGRGDGQGGHSWAAFGVPGGDYSAHGAAPLR